MHFRIVRLQAQRLVERRVRLIVLVQLEKRGAEIVVHLRKIRLERKRGPKLRHRRVDPRPVAGGPALSEQHPSEVVPDHPARRVAGDRRAIQRLGVDVVVALTPGENGERRDQSADEDLFNTKGTKDTKKTKNTKRAWRRPCGG